MSSEQGASEPKGRGVRRVVTILIAVSAALFAGWLALAVLHIELRTGTFFANTWFLVGALCGVLAFGSVAVRMFLWRKKRWFGWVGFSLVLLICAAGLFLSVAVTLTDYNTGGLRLSPKAIREHSNSIFGFDFGADEVLYVSARDPGERIVRVPEAGHTALVHATRLPFRFAPAIDWNRINGEWLMYDRSAELMRVTFKNGQAGAKVPGPDWLPPRARIVSLEASSTLSDDNTASDRTFRFAADKALDGDPRTAWVLASATSSSPGSLKMAFDRPVTADAIRILPGFFDGAKFLEYGRVASVLIALDGVSLPPDRIVPSGDRMESFVMALPRPMTFSWMELGIVGGPAGSQSSGTAVSEIELYSLGEKVELWSDPHASWDQGYYSLPPFSSMLVVLDNLYYGGDNYDEGSFRLLLRPDGTVEGTASFSDSQNTTVSITGGSWTFDHSSAQVDVTASYSWLLGQYGDEGGAFAATETRLQPFAVRMLSESKGQSVDPRYNVSSISYEFVSQEPGTFTGLPTLDFRGQGYLAPALRRHQAARSVTLQSPSLSSLPGGVFDLPLVEELSVMQSPIREVPAGIGKLAYLRKLSLSGDGLGSLPAEIGALRYLEELVVSDNRIAAFPAGLGKLKRLRLLDLSRNGLTELPAALQELQGLEVLRLEGNQLTDLPAWVAKLPNLKEIVLGGNQFSQETVRSIEKRMPIRTRSDLWERP
jgi:hypothetical protein